MHHTDSPRKLRQHADRPHGSAESRVFRAPSRLGIAVAFSALVAIASLLTFLLTGENVPTHPAPTNLHPSDSENTAHRTQSSSRYSEAPRSPASPSEPFQNAEPEAVVFTAESSSAQSTSGVSRAPQISASEIRRLQTTSSRVGHPSDIPSDEPRTIFSDNHRFSSSGTRPESAMAMTTRTSSTSQKQTAPPAPGKTPVLAASPSAEHQPTEQSSQTAAAAPKPPITQSQQPVVAPPQPTTNRPPRIWPKPFTPEEERYRQQVGVQAFINYQHELATGQKRTEEQ